MLLPPVFFPFFFQAKAAPPPKIPTPATEPITMPATAPPDKPLSPPPFAVSFGLIVEFFGGMIVPADVVFSEPPPFVVAIGLIVEFFVGLIVPGDVVFSEPTLLQLLGELQQLFIIPFEPPIFAVPFTSHLFPLGMHP